MDLKTVIKNKVSAYDNADELKIFKKIFFTGLIIITMCFIALIRGIV